MIQGYSHRNKFELLGRGVWKCFINGHFGTVFGRRFILSLGDGTMCMCHWDNVILNEKGHRQGYNVEYDLGVQP